jgi:pseudouridine kinase
MKLKDLEKLGLTEVDTDKPVLVVGAANVDIIGRLRGELQTGISNPGHIRTSFGGVARNVAENLARLGQPVRLLTVVGEDQAGRRLLTEAAEAGIDVGAVVRTGEIPTSSYLAIIDESGKLQFAVDDMRAMGELSADFLRNCFNIFQSSSLLFLDANIPKASLRTVMSLARRARLPVCADPTAATLSHRFTRYLDRIYLFTPNSSEASFFCNKSFDASNRRQALAVAKDLVSKGVRIVIITLGEFGVCYATSDASGFVPAVRTEIVDPTGAGDALTATVIFGLLNGIPLDDAVRLGVTAASLTLNHRGAVLPDLNLEILYDRLLI